MRIVLLCNAGLAIEYENQILMVDVLNTDIPPFVGLSDQVWNQMLNRAAPYDRVCGLYFTHNHPDHCDNNKVQQYRDKWPNIPCWLPNQTEHGEWKIGPFCVSFCRVNHAPMDEPLPDHVVTKIRAGDKCIYIAADAALEPKAHRQFLQNEKADAAFWNSMYLSRPETRQLMEQVSARNYIYHMPYEESDDFGI